jgi:hypothetical protein
MSRNKLEPKNRNIFTSSRIVSREDTQESQEQMHRFNNTIMGKFEKQRNAVCTKSIIDTDVSRELELDFSDPYARALEAK